MSPRRGQSDRRVVSDFPRIEVGDGLWRFGTNPSAECRQCVIAYDPVEFRTCPTCSEYDRWRVRVFDAFVPTLDQAAIH